MAGHGVVGKADGAQQQARKQDAQARHRLGHEAAAGEEQAFRAALGLELAVLDHVGQHRRHQDSDCRSSSRRRSRRTQTEVGTSHGDPFAQNTPNSRSRIGKIEMNRPTANSVTAPMRLPSRLPTGKRDQESQDEGEQPCRSPGYTILRARKLPEIGAQIDRHREDEAGGGAERDLRQQKNEKGAVVERRQHLLGVLPRSTARAPAACAGWG